jgi:hypothetical protein
MPRYDTVLNVVNDAAVELGFAAVTDPFASTDPVFIQLLRLLKSAGRELVREHRWSQLQKEGTITTVASQQSYALPADFISMVPQTGWHRTYEWPWRETDGEAWQYLQATDMASVVGIYARFWLDKVYLYPTPTADGETLAYEYRSRYWVVPTGETSPTADEPTSKTDALSFDPLLLVSALKLKWKESNGFDTAAVLADRQRAMSQCAADLAPKPILTLGRASPLVRFLDHRNVPDSDFGS